MKKEKPKPKWITMVRRKDGSAVPFDSLSPDEKSRIAGNIERKTAEIIAQPAMQEKWDWKFISVMSL